MPRFVLAYDADCGPCTRFKHMIDFIDTRNQVRFISLMEADKSGLLDSIPVSKRHTSFHLIFPSGTVLSGSEAIPSLIEILPGGKAISRVITSAPGGAKSISFVYAGFSRLHDRGSCNYEKSLLSTRAHPIERVPETPLSKGHSRSRYLLAGLLGGIVGSLAMGAVVPLPDARCLRMSIEIAGPGPANYPLAWALHIATGATFGAAFGMVASMGKTGGRRMISRNILLGLPTGLSVWAGFFIPSLVVLAPSTITNALLETSLAAHLVFGLFLGATLGVTLSLSPADLTRRR